MRQYTSQAMKYINKELKNMRIRWSPQRTEIKVKIQNILNY